MFFLPKTTADFIAAPVSSMNDKIVKGIIITVSVF